MSVRSAVGGGGGGGVEGFLKRPMLEYVASIGGSGVSLTTPVLETGRLSGKGGGGGEYVLRAPCFNLSGDMSVGNSALHAPSLHLSHRLASGESLLHVPCWNLSRRSSGG